jgi:hypothetical protein
MCGFHWRYAGSSSTRFSGGNNDVESGALVGDEVHVDTGDEEGADRLSFSLDADCGCLSPLASFDSLHIITLDFLKLEY